MSIGDFSQKKDTINYILSKRQKKLSWHLSEISIVDRSAELQHNGVFFNEHDFDQS